MKYSPSRHKTLVQCPRLYYLHYIQGWRTTIEKPWLTYGSAIDDLLGIYDLQGFEKCMDSIEKYFSNPYDIIDIKYLLNHYHEKYKHQILEPMEVDGKPGNQWYGCVQLKSETIKCDISVEGYFDKLANNNGHPCIVERKTTSDSINYVSKYWNKLPQDKQIICYSYIISEVISSSVSTVFYEVLRKPSPQASPVFKRYHVVKKETVPWTLEEYEQRVACFFAEPQKNEMVSRRKIQITDDMINEWMYDLISDNDNLENMMGNSRGYENLGIDPLLAFPRNQNGCDKWGGCIFKKFCDGKSELADIEDLIKKDV